MLYNTTTLSDLPSTLAGTASRPRAPPTARCRRSCGTTARRAGHRSPSHGAGEDSFCQRMRIARPARRGRPEIQLADTPRPYFPPSSFPPLNRRDRLTSLKYAPESGSRRRSARVVLEPNSDWICAGESPCGLAWRTMRWLTVSRQAGFMPMSRSRFSEFAIMWPKMTMVFRRISCYAGSATPCPAFNSCVLECDG